MEKHITLEELGSIAHDLLERARMAKSSTATLITLSGDLGAGKTTLTQQIADTLGVRETVISPTFVIMKSYKTTDNDFKNLVHIDAYRLNHSKELLNLGWEKMLADKENLIIVEWPERVPECVIGKTCHVELLHIDENTRGIVFK